MAGNADMGKSVELGFHCPGADFKLARPESCSSGMGTCRAFGLLWIYLAGGH